MLNFDPPPAMATLRQWAQAGFIHPAPVKICRRWMVEETAEYCEQGLELPANVSNRVADILMAA